MTIYDGLTEMRKAGMNSTPKEKKRNKTIYTGKLPTRKKKNKKSFWVIFLITTTSMEIKTS